MKKRIIVYAGQYYDHETGLHYNYHRYYDPSLGRYLRADPIGLAGGVNLYAYVQNNPVNAIDLYGLIDWLQVASGSAITLGGIFHIAAGEYLIVQSAADVESLYGIPFAAHQFGAGVGMVLEGTALTEFGAERIFYGLYDYDAMRAEANKKGEEKAKAQFDEMERQYNRINEWVDDYCRKHPELLECQGEDNACKE